jgi:DNA gyrase/topoisomerase IV subunit B
MEDESEYDDGNIVVLEGLDAIRCRPAMYLGGLERDDLFDDLIFESLCHAIDEAIDDGCKYIKINIKPTDVVFIQYDAGMSLETRGTDTPVADSLLTQLHACHNLKKNIDVGSKYCQLGLAVLNAVCSEFQVDIIWSGKRGRQTYIKGKADRDFIISESDEIDRTQFRFSFDVELLGKHAIHLDRLQLKADKLMQDFGVKLDITHS